MQAIPWFSEINTYSCSFCLLVTGLFYFELDPNNRFEDLETLVHFHSDRKTVLHTRLVPTGTAKLATGSSSGQRTRTLTIATKPTKRHAIVEHGSREHLTLEAQHRVSESIARHHGTLDNTRLVRGEAGW